jgi:hypothetical protein
VLCVAQWSAHQLVKSEDVRSISEMKDEEGDAEREMDDGWDVIKLK